MKIKISINSHCLARETEQRAPGSHGLRPQQGRAAARDALRGVHGHGVRADDRRAARVRRVPAGMPPAAWITVGAVVVLLAASSLNWRGKKKPRPSRPRRRTAAAAEGAPARPAVAVEVRGAPSLRRPSPRRPHGILQWKRRRRPRRRRQGRREASRRPRSRATKKVLSRGVRRHDKAGVDAAAAKEIHRRGRRRRSRRPRPRSETTDAAEAPRSKVADHEVDEAAVGPAQ